MANIFLSSLSTLLAIALFEKYISRELIEFLVWLSVTIFIITFCEIIPKIYAKSNPEKMSLLVIKPIGLLNRIIYPIARPFIWFSGSILGIKSTMPVSKINSITAEEIRKIILDSGSKGLLGKETAQMLDGMLKLSRIKVSDIMAPVEKIESVNIDEPPEKVIDALLETGRSRIPVYSGDKKNITGIVLLKDLVTAGNREKIEFTPDLVRPAHFVTMDEKISSLLLEFRKGTTHCAVVIDYNLNIKGFVTLEDVLEEIVGEIIDEYELAYSKKIETSKEK